MLTVQIGKDGSYEINLTDDSLVVTAELLSNGRIMLNITKKEELRHNIQIGHGGASAMRGDASNYPGGTFRYPYGPGGETFVAGGGIGKPSNGGCTNGQ